MNKVAFFNASKYYPIPMIRTGNQVTLRFSSPSLDLSGMVTYGIREADGCCGAWHLWLPECSVNERSSFRKEIDLDAALGEHKPKDRQEFEAYCWFVLCNSIYSYVFSTHRNGLFAQDGARKVVDKLMEYLPLVKHARPVYINQPGNTRGNITVSGLDPSGETGTRRVVVPTAWASRARVQKTTFLSAHGTYNCSGYTVDFGASRRLTSASWYHTADNARVYAAYMERR